MQNRTAKKNVRKHAKPDLMLRTQHAAIMDNSRNSGRANHLICQFLARWKANDK